MKENSKAGPTAARFSLTFDDEDGASGVDHGPVSRPLSHHRTTFSTRFAESPQARPLLDSDEDVDEDDEDAAPLDFPLHEGALRPRMDSAPSERSSLNDPATESGAKGLLAQIRDQFRANRDEALERKKPEPPGAPPQAELRRSLPSRPEKVAGTRKPSRFWLGPVVMLLGAGGAYLVSTTSLSLIGPSLNRRSPRVPDLGSLSPTQNLPAAAADAQQAPGAPRPSAPSITTPLVENLPLPEGEAYPGRGLLEIVTSERELVYVDGIFIGRGPLRRIPLQPGHHAIVIRSGGIDRSAQADLQAGAQTRVHFEGGELPPIPTELAEPE